MKFKFGDKVIVQLTNASGNPIKKRRKAVYIGRANYGWSYVILRNDMTMSRELANTAQMHMDYAGTFTLKTARGGFRYNVTGLNNEPITTSEVLKAKQSATDMHEKHFRQYRLIDKTKPRAK